MTKPRHTMHMVAGHNSYANNPVIFYRHGYIWVGNDAPGDKRCFAFLDEHKAIRMARAILNRAGPVPHGGQEGVPPMILRSLLEKATEKVKLAREYDGEIIKRTVHIGEGFSMWRTIFPTQADADLYVAIHNCADELLRVREAGEVVVKMWQDPRFHHVPDGAIALLEDALARLREKEGG